MWALSLERPDSSRNLQTRRTVSRARHARKGSYLRQVEDHVGALSQLVPRGNIPAFLGGDAALCPIGDGSVATSSSVPPPPKSEQPQRHQSHAEGVARAASPAVNAEPRAPSSRPASSASGEAAAAVVAAAVAEVSSGSRVGQST